jgi:signal transduction histidine kinase/AmiR/NasT family two-component response regulator
MTTREDRVLVLAPVGRDAALSCAILKHAGIEAEVCPSIESLCEGLEDAAGAAIIAEEALPPDAVARLVRTLDAQPPWSDIPLILLAGDEFGASSIRPLHVLRPLRNVMILERPVRRLILTQTVAIALRARRRQYQLRAYLEERAQLLENERAARATAERVNRMKDEFLMTVSHELRTPLTAIYGWARMLVTGQIREEQRQRAIETIERNAQAQVQLVNDLLDVSRAISGKVRLDVRRVDAGGVVLAAVDSIRPAADAKGIHLNVAVDEHAGSISVDAGRIQQVVWNLLSNAVKFTAAGGSVDIRLSRQGDQIELVVADTGCGIEPDFVPYVFDRFRQGDAGTTRQHGGLGLGLAIVRHLVELHGGTVAAESRGAGLGATFRVLLPRARSRDGAAAAPREDARAAAPSPVRARRLDGLRVLVVDDDPQACELFAAILEHAGAEARLVGTGRAAIELLRGWWPDVLLSDIEMPDEDGYLLMEQVTAMHHASRAPLVAVAATAHSRPEDRRRAIEAGFQWHLPKPVEPSELVTVIASLTGRSRGAGDLQHAPVPLGDLHDG